MSRDDEIRSILERARQTRRPLPRWLWLAAAVVVAITVVAAVAVLLGDPAPRHAGPGFGSGQRPDHSSRSSP